VGLCLREQREQSINLKIMTLPDIKNTLTTLKPELHERFGVSEIGVFGSWVRGEQNETSDIDVLVDFDRAVDLFDLMELQEFLESVFRLKIDVALRRSLKKYIGKQILAEVQYL
jgi:predicted nucleotidyltransferase